MNLEDRIASGAFTLIAEIGVNYYDIARQRGISYGGGKAHVQRSERSWRSCGEISDVQGRIARFPTFSFVLGYERGILQRAIRALQAIRLVWREGVSRTFRLLRLDRDRFLLLTPFDFESADYLEPDGGIQSVFIRPDEHPFHRASGSKGKPMIFRLGLAT